MITLRFSLPLTSCTLSLDTTLQSHSTTAIFGESGAGKTTILRILAGLIQPQTGYIEVEGEVWFDSKRRICLPPQKRNIGFVFQDYALFPHMSVEKNLLYGNKDSSFSEELLALMNLSHLKHRLPSELSGGQCQRVALARAIMRRPKILLLDEPLSALDARTRHHLQNEILKLQDIFHLNIVLVSHDISEIMRLAQRVIGLEHGQCTKDAHPKDFFIRPHISSKIQWCAEVLEITHSDILTILTLLTQGNIIKVTMSRHEFLQEHPHLCEGAKVMICDKAFNPILIDLDSDPKDTHG